MHRRAVCICAHFRVCNSAQVCLNIRSGELDLICWRTLRNECETCMLVLDEYTVCWQWSLLSRQTLWMNSWVGAKWEMQRFFSVSFPEYRPFEQGFSWKIFNLSFLLPSPGLAAVQCVIALHPTCQTVNCAFVKNNKMYQNMILFESRNIKCVLNRCTDAFICSILQSVQSHIGSILVFLG